MQDIYIYNGVKLDQPLITINRGFLYADGFFESMLYKNGAIELWDLHVDRLTENCRLLYIDSPDVQYIYQQIVEQLNSFDSEKTYRVRLTIYREGLGFYKPEKNKAEWLAHIMQIEVPQETVCKLSIEKELKKSITPFSNLKSLNAQLFILITRKPEHALADEIVLLNESNHVCETSSSNIFWLKAGTYYTPSLQTGCIGGVMRRHMIQKLTQEGSTVLHVAEPVDSLLHADEIFVSNAVRGWRKAQVM